MNEKEDPETSTEGGESSDLQGFADVVSGYIGAASSSPWTPWPLPQRNKYLWIGRSGLQPFDSV